MKLRHIIPYLMGKIGWVKYNEKKLGNLQFILHLNDIDEKNIIVDK